MADRNYWIIGADGKPYGPADLDTLRRWISERRVTAATPVATSADGPWEDASGWTELEEALGLDRASQPAAAGAAASALPSSPSAPPPPGSAVPSAWPPGNLQTVLLIGGVCNIVFAAASTLALVVGTFGFGCCCAFPGIIMLVVGVLQCLDYTKASQMSADAYLDRTRTWGIVNVCMFLLGNWPTAVCGLLQLVWLGDARQRVQR